MTENADLISNRKLPDTELCTWGEITEYEWEWQYQISYTKLHAWSDTENITENANYDQINTRYRTRYMMWNTLYIENGNMQSIRKIPDTEWLTWGDIQSMTEKPARMLMGRSGMTAGSRPMIGVKSWKMTITRYRVYTEGSNTVDKLTAKTLHWLPGNWKQEI